MSVRRSRGAALLVAGLGACSSYLPGKPTLLDAVLYVDPAEPGVVDATLRVEVSGNCELRADPEVTVGGHPLELVQRGEYLGGVSHDGKLISGCRDYEFRAIDVPVPPGRTEIAMSRGPTMSFDFVPPRVKGPDPVRLRSGGSVQLGLVTPAHQELRTSFEFLGDDRSRVRLRHGDHVDGKVRVTVPDTDVRGSGWLRATFHVDAMVDCPAGVSCELQENGSFDVRATLGPATSVTRPSAR